MLSLTRKPNEAVILTIGDVRVRVVVATSSTSKIVRLGIDAPREVKVLREELPAKPEAA